MKKTAEFLKNFLVSASLVNLGVTIAVIAIFVSADTFDINAVMQLELLISAVVFSGICGVAFSVFKAIKGILPMFRYILEYIVCLFGLYVSFFGMTGNGKSYVAFFAVATIFTIGYILIGVCIYLGKKLLSGGFKKKPVEEYKNVFDELK